MDAARVLLGSFRSGEANDPEVYLTSVVHVMQHYPIDVVLEAVNPLTGLPSRLNWLPTIAEVSKELDRINGFRRRQEEWDERSREQLRERQERVNLLPSHGIRPNRHWANVLVHPEAPQYRAMCERAADPKTDAREWRWDETENADRRGIWVIKDWLPKAKVLGYFDVKP